MNVINVLHYVIPFLSVTVLTPGVAVAGLVHSHCDVQPWTESFITNNTRRGYDIPSGGLDYRLGGNATDYRDFQFDTSPRTTPPPSSMADCFYEISDITKIDITFEFTGTMIWNSLKVSGGGTGTLLDANFDMAPPFGSGVATSFTFQSHLMGNAMMAGPLELSLPNESIFTRLIDDNNGFVITKAEITMSGNHYYIPEPSTAILLLAGFAMLLRRGTGVLPLASIHGMPTANSRT